MKKDFFGSEFQFIETGPGHAMQTESYISKICFNLFCKQRNYYTHVLLRPTYWTGASNNLPRASARQYA